MAQVGKLNQWLRQSFSILKRVFQGDLFIKGRVHGPLPPTEIKNQTPSGKGKTSPEDKEPTVPIQGRSFFQNLFRKPNADSVSVETAVEKAMPFPRMSRVIPPCRQDFEVLSTPKQDSIDKSSSTNAKDDTVIKNVSSVDLLVDFFDTKYGKRAVQRDSMEITTTTALTNGPHPEMWDRRLRLKVIAQSNNICLSKELPKKDGLEQETLDENGKPSKARFCRTIYYKRLGPKQ
ncbi:uncharacterized protein LOC6600160 [Drosophila persimilis]|uniref:uncharacterized protein LOC6600160 n=1 Tax=Drosophila persimilis TaxID=7234 RepID=UPI000F094FA4|nr:uncharacterized protein LOC6600160 [Drosophila persimilis]